MNAREMMDFALACETKADADAWMAAEVERRRWEYRQSAEFAMETIREGLWYQCGYYSRDVGDRVRALFGAAGSILCARGESDRASQTTQTDEELAVALECLRTCRDLLQEPVLVGSWMQQADAAKVVYLRLLNTTPNVSAIAAGRIRAKQ